MSETEPTVVQTAPETAAAPAVPPAAAEQPIPAPAPAEAPAPPAPAAETPVAPAQPAPAQAELEADHAPEPVHVSEVHSLAGDLHSKLAQLGGGASAELAMVKRHLMGALHWLEEHIKL